MPTPPNPSRSTPPGPTVNSFAPRNRLRLHKLLRTTKLLAALFVLAFFCAYLRTYLRYGTPHTQTQASVAPTATELFTPARTRPDPRRHVFLPVRHVKRHPQHPGIYHLATLRRIRRFFSQLLDVRS